VLIDTFFEVIWIASMVRTTFRSSCIMYIARFSCCAVSKVTFAENPGLCVIFVPFLAYSGFKVLDYYTSSMDACDTSNGRE
jgi:hypothetical protein